MATLKGRFKVETGGVCHMLPLVDVTGSGIYIRKWVGRLLEIMVKEEEITEGWVFQRREGHRMKISDMNEGFEQGLSRLKL